MSYSLAFLSATRFPMVSSLAPLPHIDAELRVLRDRVSDAAHSGSALRTGHAAAAHRSLWTVSLAPLSSGPGDCVFRFFVFCPAFLPFLPPCVLSLLRFVCPCRSSRPLLVTVLVGLACVIQAGRAPALPTPPSRHRIRAFSIETGVIAIYISVTSLLYITEYQTRTT